MRQGTPASGVWPIKAHPEVPARDKSLTDLPRARDHRATDSRWSISMMLNTRAVCAAATASMASLP